MTTDRILRNVIIGGIFLLPFIPFIVTSSMFFPFITGKNFAFRILIEILFALWLILAFRNIHYRPTFSFVLVSVFSFVGIIALSGLFGENPFKSFWSNFERMEGLVGLLHLLMLFLVGGTVFNTRRLWIWLAHTSIGASVIMGIYSILQFMGAFTINQGGVRVDGTFGNASYLAVYMLFHIFITGIFLLNWRGSMFVRILYGLIILLQAGVLFYTATRGAILGLMGGIFLATILFALFGRELPRLRKVSIGVIIALVIAVAGFLTIKETSFVEENLVLSRLANISLSEGSSRFTIWGMAFEGFKEHPILGWGQENFNYVFNEYYKPILHDDEPWFDRAHNIFFDWLIAGGALGLLAYLSIFLALLYYLWRREGRVQFSLVERGLFTGLLAGYFFHNLFVFDNVVSYVLFFSLLAYIYSQTRPSIRENSMLAYPFNRGVITFIVVPIVGISLAATLYYLNVPGIKTSLTMIEAFSTSNLAKRTELFEKAAAYNSLGSQEVAEQLVQSANQAARSDTPIEERQAIFALAKREIEEEIEHAPNDARLYVFLASLYEQFGQLENAKREIEKAIELSPSKQRIHYQLAFNYVNRGEFDQALRVFERAYGLEPAIHESAIYYAALAIYNGNEELGEEILAPIREELNARGDFVIDDSTLLQAYIETENFEKVLEIWQYKVEKNPEDISIRLSLAATLVQLGRNTEAIQVIQQAIEIEPRFREQGGQFIQEIRAGRGLELLEN